MKTKVPNFTVQLSNGLDFSFREILQEAESLLRYDEDSVPREREIHEKMADALQRIIDEMQSTGTTEHFT